MDREKYRRNAPARRLKSRGYRLKAVYGITEADYDRMFADQKGLCALCGRAKPGGNNAGRLSVDHDHNTGRVRGLLCFKCNTDLGVYEKFASRPEVRAYLQPEAS